VVSQPIKGTRRCPAGDELEAVRLRDELTASEKDRAENVMIVDLMRNDLGQVCESGTIVADPVCDVQAMTGVWHLVSTVRGTLPAGTGDDALAAAVLPAGSVTGAPKRAALATIAELESSARQAFCGSVVLASPVAGLELSVVIRTLECAGDDVWIDVGGGVTAASDPAAEAAECLAKAEPVLRAVGACVPNVGAAAAGPEPLRLQPVPLPRPDPQAGIITTLRADAGHAERLGEHLSRLERSSRLVYGLHLPDRIGRKVRDVAAQTFDSQRIRVTMTPTGEATVEAWTIDAADEPIVLEPVCLPGGLGPHKWADRRLVNALEHHTAPAEPLLCDLDGIVLEATRWALVAELDGALVTPPDDGRILPSLGISTMHEAIRPVAMRLTLSDLARARVIYVVNSVRGMVPVQEITGVWALGD
jgi:para-aminobenzoate synthetase/4-amino-4-deoxychorismate lyase